MLNIRTVSLAFLCVVMTAQAVVMHISRTDRDPNVPLYKAAAAVIITELGKLIVSLGLALRECRETLRQERLNSSIRTVGESVEADSEKRMLLQQEQQQEEHSTSDHLLSHPPCALPSMSDVFRRVKEDTFGPDWTKLSIPAMLFTGQANLAYYASANLSVPVFQITYQLKIPATALCSVIMLKRSLSRLQWLSILVLSLGVGIVQLASTSADAKYHVHKPEHTSSSGSAEPIMPLGEKELSPRISASAHVEMNQMLGLMAVVLACLSSGFSGVYFGKVLKKKSINPASAAPGSYTQNPPLSAVERKTGLWIRNIQLSLFSLLVGSFIYFSTSPPSQYTSLLSPSNFLEGFTPIVYLLIFIQISGGLLAAIVIQYADNIAKSFAASLSILLSFVASVYMFGYKLNAGIVAGSTLVIGATYLFNYSPSPASRLGHYNNASSDSATTQSLLPQTSPRLAPVSAPSPFSAAVEKIGSAVMSAASSSSGYNTPTGGDSANATVEVVTDYLNKQAMKPTPAYRI